MIRILNTYSLERDHNQIDVYVGNGSLLANKWTHIIRRMTPAKYVVDTPEAGVARYAEWMDEQMDEPKGAVYKEIHRIARIAKTWDINLVCYTNHRPCHADVIKSVIDKIGPP